MSTTEKLRSLAAKLTKAAATLTDEIGEVRREILVKRRELERARTAPIPLEELEERIAGVVDECARIWLREWGVSLLCGERGLASYAPRYSVVVPWSIGDGVPWGAYCAGDPDAAAAFLGRLAARIPYEAGSPSAERPELVDHLVAELGELEAMEEKLIDDAAKAGVVIEHRPEVLQRRNDEARRRELEEERVEARRQRQEAVDRAHASRPTTGRSQYLTDQASDGDR